MSKVWILVLAVLLTLGLGLPMNANADQTMEGGTDFPGHDLKRIEIEPTIAGAAICQGFCVNLQTCHAWTFVASGVQGPKAQCYLKFDIPAAVRNPCCQSGVVGRVAEANIDRPGMDFLKLTVTAPGECLKFCFENSRCMSWTFVVRGVQGPSAFCYLKNGVPDARNDDCCTSGVKGGAKSF
jgi:PAN domain